MTQFLIYGMIYLGSILMAYNIYRYVLFSRHIREHGNWDQERQLFNVPIILLILFLVGYLAVGFLGHPDFVISGILFGGSIFVFVMLLLIQRTVSRIHENERLEAELKAAEEASKAKTFFLSNMSHDIRTPLNAIIGYTTLANQETDNPEKKTEYLRKIEAAGQQLLAIVDDVLEMSRIENGSVDLKPVRTNLEHCLHEAADLIREQMTTKHITFHVQCNIRNPWVLCDKNQLNRVLMNLLSNACKFTGENGTVSFSLTERSTSEATGTYEFRVKDTGIGMSPEFAEHIFTPFERERTSTISRTQGTGLGMAITRNIIDRMKGHIEIITEKGKGSEFIITVDFPITEASPEALSPEKEPVDFDSARLLLAEDNVINMEIACLILTQAGLQVETAENGQQAVEMLCAAGPGYYEAVLMDIQMPVMDGYTATRAIRALPDPELARIPIIAMTANAFQEDIRAAEDAGMNGHIAKPLDVDKMMTTLKTVLQNRAGGA